MPLLACSSLHSSLAPPSPAGVTPSASYACHLCIFTVMEGRWQPFAVSSPPEQPDRPLASCARHINPTAVLNTGAVSLDLHYAADSMAACLGGGHRQQSCTVQGDPWPHEAHPAPTTWHPWPHPDSLPCGILFFSFIKMTTPKMSQRNT